MGVRMIEEIYEYIKKNNKPLSISEIHENINNIPKKELTLILQELNNRNLIYRSIEKGKAYYSINSEEGEGRNPVQQGIEDLRRKIIINLNCGDSEVVNEK